MTLFWRILVHFLFVESITLPSHRCDRKNLNWKWYHGCLKLIYIKADISSCSTSSMALEINVQKDEEEKKTNQEWFAMGCCCSDGIVLMQIIRIQTIILRPFAVISKCWDWVFAYSERSTKMVIIFISKIYFACCVCVWLCAVCDCQHSGYPPHISHPGLQHVCDVRAGVRCSLNKIPTPNIEISQ